MSSNIPLAPQGNVPAIGIPDSQDIPRLVFSAPYFEQVPLAELIEPSVIEAVEAALPSLVPPYVDAAAQTAVQQLAVLLTGSTMTGPLFLSPLMPTQPSQAATMAYVDAMIATAGIPEVPPVPSGQVWARETGQWVPITPQTGVFLPLSGGSMTGNINMSGNTITNLASVPAMPNGAAPAQWVLNNIAAVSLYQGTWDADTNTPDLTQLSTHVNAWTWIALTTSVSGVVIGPAIPGLQGQTVFNGDTIIYSTAQGAFSSIHAGGISLPEADGRYVQLAGSQMSGALLLNANATQPLQAATFGQLEAALANTVTPDAPADGQGYLRVGVGTTRWTPGLPLAGGILTGALTLVGPGASGNNAVTVTQLNSSITAGTAGLMPIAGGTFTGAVILNGNASSNLNPVPLQQLNSMLVTYAPLQNPAFSGVPTAPTATPATTNTTQLATCAFVQSAISAGAFLPLAGGTLTGPISLSGNAAANLNPVPLQQLTAQLGNYLPLAGGTLTGGLNVTGSLGTTQNVFSGASVTIGGTPVSGTWQPVPANAGWTIYGPNASYFFALAQTVDPNWQWGYGSTLQMRLYNNGNLVIGGTLTQGSDAANKTNIAPITQGISLIRQLIPKSFQRASPAPRLTNTPPEEPVQWGFIAQDVASVLPEAVGEAAGVGDNPSTLTLDITGILAAVTYAAQQMDRRITALEEGANITPPAADLA